LLPPAVGLLGAVDTVVDRVDGVLVVVPDELDVVGLVAGVVLVLVPVPAEEASPRTTAA
jgi:hypothetical protein